MTQPRYLYAELSALVAARLNCIADDARYKPTDVSQSITMRRGWIDKHTERIHNLVGNHMPSGSGFDQGTGLDLDASHADKLVFTTSYHHMNDGGMYDGWTEHTVTVTPSFNGLNIRVSGRNRNDIKEYIRDCFDSALETELTGVCRHCGNVGPYMTECQNCEPQDGLGRMRFVETGLAVESTVNVGEQRQAQETVSLETENRK